ncbi:hypothetical protein ACHAXS_001048 [Conticribra weissflogii]
MKEIVEGQLRSDATLWRAQAENNCADVDALRDMFEKGGWTAAVDFPASLCYERLMRVFPDAKIVHTERKSAEQWWDSASNSIMIVGTIFPYNIFYNRIPFFRSHKAMSDAMWGRVLGGRKVTVDDDDFPQAYREEFIAAYEANNVRVRKVVPRKRLLIQDHSKGWTDLCIFLKKEVPDVPYPHVNTLDDFYKFANYVAMKIAIGASVAFAVFVLAVRKLMTLLTNSEKMKES